MKILITNPAASPPLFTICNGRNDSPLDDLDLAHGEEFQEVQYIRGDSIKLFQRKNARCDFSFTILYKKSSMAVAEAWLFQIASFMPRFGNLIITTEVGDGGSTGWTIANASCQIVSAKQIGSAVLVTFRVRGGKPTASS